MSAPEYVPATDDPPRTHHVPRRRPRSWVPNRPGELVGAPPPTGRDFGAPGPDQGFALTLARRAAAGFELVDGEDLDDVVTGVVAVALRRASLAGRAPVVHDVEVAATLLGLTGDADPEHVAWRVEALAELAEHHHHHLEARHLANAIPAEVLAAPPAEVARAVAADWRAAVGLVS